MKRKAIPREFFELATSAAEGARCEAKASAAACGISMLTRCAVSRFGKALTQPPMHLVVMLATAIGVSPSSLTGLKAEEPQADSPDTSTHTFVLKQSHQMLGPFLKVLMDDLGDFGVRRQLWVQRLANQGVDVCDVCMSETGPDRLGSDHTGTSSDNDLHDCCVCCVPSSG